MEMIEARMRGEGLAPAEWRDGPNDRYAAHEHAYHKVLYCVEGSITFVLVTGERLELRPGDRLDLPAGWPHAATVGADGVTCVEAQKRS
jgi:quercetin dioxygenase-like cupin family protein